MTIGLGILLINLTDLTSYENYPNFALINKWRLEKKDPDAEFSEPVEPIVYWVENTTSRRNNTRCCCWYRKLEYCICRSRF